MTSPETASETVPEPARPDLSPPKPNAVRINRLPLYLMGAFGFLLIVLANVFLVPSKPRSASQNPAPAPDEQRLAQLLEEQRARADRPAPAWQRSAQPTPAPDHPWRPVSRPRGRRAAAASGGLRPQEARNGRPSGGVSATAAPASRGAAASGPAGRPLRGPPAGTARSAGSPAEDLAALDPLSRALLPAITAATGASVPPAPPSAPATAHGAAAEFLASRAATQPPLRLSPGAPPEELARTLLQGTLIPATLLVGLDSELPGQVVAFVRRPVCDTLTGRHLLIPQGSRLVGEYAELSSPSRLLVAWQRLILPDGSSYELGALPSADLEGASGLSGKVHNHWSRLFGSALLLSALSAGAQLSQTPSDSDLRRAPSPAEVGAAALGQELNQLGSALLRRGLAANPTLRIPAGTPFHVVVTRDIVFSPNLIRRGHG